MSSIFSQPMLASAAERTNGWYSTAQ